jgi:hypothetical protein
LAADHVPGKSNLCRGGRKLGDALILDRTDARPRRWDWSDRGVSTLLLARHPMATKKKSKGVLEKIGDAVATGAEAVVDAGSKAIHSIGDLLPTGKPAPKRARPKPKSAAEVRTARTDTKVAASKTASSKAAAPKAKTSAKAAAPNAEAKATRAKTAAPVAKAVSKAPPAKPAKSAKTTTPPKSKGGVSKKS